LLLLFFLFNFYEKKIGFTQIKINPLEEESHTMPPTTYGLEGRMVKHRHLKQSYMHCHHWKLGGGNAVGHQWRLHATTRVPQRAQPNKFETQTPIIEPKRIYFNLLAIKVA